MNINEVLDGTKDRNYVKCNVTLLCRKIIFFSFLKEKNVVAYACNPSYFGD
jgi:hypothetical protein